MSDLRAKLLRFARVVPIAALLASGLAVSLPLVVSGDGSWSGCYWDPYTRLGWRSRSKFAEKWLFVDAFATRRTTLGDSSAVATGSDLNDPAIIEAMGCSPCDLWDAHYAVPQVWPLTVVHKARQRSYTDHCHVVLVGYGWPFVQFWHMRWVDGRGSIQTDRWISLASADRRTTSLGAASPGLPWGIRWPGLCTNVLAWSAAIWIGRSSWLWWRTSWRKRRCLCARCLYPVSESERCPECGMPS